MKVRLTMDLSANDMQALWSLLNSTYMRIDPTKRWSDKEKLDCIRHNMADIIRDKIKQHNNRGRVDD